MNKKSPNTKIIPLFSKPVLYKKINFIEESLRKEFFNTDLIEVIGGDGKLLTSLNQKLLHEEKYKQILEAIQSEINWYVYDILNVSKDITFNIFQSWLVKHTDREHFSQPHVHVGAILSGCLYIKTNKKCGNIKFVDFQQGYTSKALPYPFSFTYEKYNIYNSSDWEIEVEDDLLLIFPSDLYHYTDRNSSTEPRYCICFDVVADGIFNPKCTLQNTKKMKIKIDA